MAYVMENCAKYKSEYYDIYKIKKWTTNGETEFNKIWSNYFINKKYATLVENGKTAIFEALKILNSKHVALPTYTCHSTSSMFKCRCYPLHSRLWFRFTN